MQYMYIIIYTVHAIDVKPMEILPPTNWIYRISHMKTAV